MLGGNNLCKSLRDYWQKNLCLPPGASSFESPVTADEPGWVACEETVESRIVIEDDAGKPCIYQLTPVQPTERFSKLPKQNWTLLGRP